MASFLMIRAAATAAGMTLPNYAACLVGSMKRSSHSDSVASGHSLPSGRSGAQSKHSHALC